MNEFKNLGKEESTPGKQYLTVTCPKRKLELKFFIVYKLLYP